MTFFGTSAKFIDAVRKAGLRPDRHARPAARPDHLLDRLAAVAGGLRLRLRRHQAGRPSRLDLRRHRHRLLLRARRSDRARVRGRDPGAGPRHGGRRLGRRRRGRCAARRASSSAPRPSRPCRSASGTIPTARSTAPPISSASPTSGAMATSPNGRSMAASIIHGRSDATLNPRRRAHRHGRDLQPGRADAGDRRGALHRPGLRRRRARRAVRAARRRRGARRRPGDSASDARSAPAPARATCRPRIVAVADIPRTKSGKITELAVREVVHGRPVKNREALANPEALELFRDLPD